MKRPNHSKHEYLKTASLWLAVITALASLVLPYIRFAGFESRILLELIANLGGAITAAAIAYFAIRWRDQVRSEHVPRVFISYAHANSDLAIEIARRLEKVGAKPVLDRFELEVGEDIGSAVTRMMEGADYFLAIVTPEFASSAWAKKELEAAMGMSKRILPAVFDLNSIPEVLHGIYYANFTDSQDRGYAELERTILRHRRKGGEQSAAPNR